MSTLDQVTRLVQQALDDFDKPESSVTSLLRWAARIARLRNDFDNLWWLELELSPMGEEEKRRRYDEVAPHYTREELEKLNKKVTNLHIERRRCVDVGIDGKPKDKLTLATLPVPELEDQVELLLREAEARASLLDPDQVKVRRFYLISVRELNGVLSRIRQSCYVFLSQTERELAYGQANADIWERNRRYVDQRINVIAPDVLDQFSAAYKRLAEEDQEARSHALTSCRRILKSLADNLYPPPSQPVVGSDGKERKLTENMFVARLWQFVHEKAGAHTSGKLLLAEVESIGHRVDRLNELSSKGVHDLVAQSEVEQCVIQTYLVVGDILRVADGTTAVGTAA